MTRILKIAAVAFVIMLSSPWRNKVAAQPYADDEVTYQTFYDQLSPYGEWVDNPEYGYVWVPEADEDFRPYTTNGHWVYTDDFEWMWVSDYDWGWAPFHYGRWNEDPSYGWFWVPGYEWSPAWVAWRDGGDYYGWAPLRPGINISIGFSNYAPPVDYWSFAPRQYITSPRIYDYCYDRRQNVTIINQTTIINNYGYSNNVFRGGPRRNDVERYTGRITPVRFRESNAPGRGSYRNNEVSMYRPNVRRDNNRQFAPRTFERYDRNRVANTNGGRINRTDGRDRSGGGVRTDRGTMQNGGFGQRTDQRTDQRGDMRTQRDQGQQRQQMEQRQQTDQRQRQWGNDQQRGQMPQRGQQQGTDAPQRQQMEQRGQRQREEMQQRGQMEQRQQAEAQQRGQMQQRQQAEMQQRGQMQQRQQAEMQQREQQRGQMQQRQQAEMQQRGQMQQRQQAEMQQREQQRGQMQQRQQMEQRQPQQRPQMEQRRVEQPQQQAQQQAQQPRQMERRENAPQSNGNGGERGRRGRN